MKAWQPSLGNKALGSIEQIVAIALTVGCACHAKAALHDSRKKAFSVSYLTPDLPVIM
jgi:hypothetical protein